MDLCMFFSSLKNVDPHYYIYIYIYIYSHSSINCIKKNYIVNGIGRNLFDRCDTRECWKGVGLGIVDGFNGIFVETRRKSLKALSPKETLLCIYRCALLYSCIVYI